MKKILSEDIIKRHRLIRSKLSNKILWAIIHNTSLAHIKLPEWIDINKIEEVRKLYNIKAQSISHHVPRNLVFYHIIKDKMPTFSWSTDGSTTDITTPRIENIHPSIMSLLLENFDIEQDSFLHRKYPYMNQLSSSVVGHIAVFMEKTKCLYPENNIMQAIIKWVQAGLDGEKLTVFAPICPDYSTQETDDPNYKIYTFDEVGSGIGVVAQSILNAIPAIIELIKNLNLDIEIIIVTGDFEAYNISNLDRLRISTEEFLLRLRKSNLAIQKACDYPIKTIMATDLCNGYQAWQETTQELQEMFENHDFGKSGLTEQKLLDIISARKALYDRWAKIYSTKEEYIPQLLTQGVEYSALGRIFAKYRKNFMILGADHSVMGPFYNIDRTIPILYLKKAYI